jgi:ribosome-binding protein aMBF1 (putative translation factor)
MIIHATITKTGKWYAIEIPALGAHTQASTKAEALKMAAAVVRDLVDDQEMPVEVQADKDFQNLSIDADAATMLPFILRAQRRRAGLSVRDCAQRMNSKSPTAFARYEAGRAVPSVAKLDELMHSLGMRLSVEPVGMVAANA